MEIAQCPNSKAPFVFDRKSDLEKEVDRIYLRYCESWSQNGTQMYEFVNSWIHDDSNFTKTRIFRYMTREGYQGVDCFKARKILHFLLIKRAAREEKRISSKDLGFMIHKLIHYKNNYLNGYFRFYGPEVLGKIRIGQGENRFPLWFPLVCFRDYFLHLDGRMGKGCRMLDKMLDLFKENLNLKDEDLTVSYQKHLQSFINDIPEYCRWDNMPISKKAKHIDAELVCACKKFDLSNIVRCLALGASPVVEIGGKTLLGYLRAMIESMGKRLYDHSTIAGVTMGMFFLSLYQQEYALLRKRFEEMKDELIESDSKIKNLLRRSDLTCAMIRKCDFHSFDNLKPLFKLFPALSMDEGYYLDGFVVKRGSRRGELRLYARKVGLYKIWGKKSVHYIDGQHIRDSVSEEKEKLVPPVFDHVIVPFTTEGVWDAFLLWLAPRVQFGIRDDKYDQYYVTALSTRGICRLFDYYERIDEYLMPKLTMINDYCYEVIYPWALLGHSFQRKRVYIYRKGLGVRFSEPEAILEK